MNDLITHAGGRQEKADFEVFFPSNLMRFFEAQQLGHWMINHDFAAVQWVNGRLLVKAQNEEMELLQRER